MWLDQKIGGQMPPDTWGTVVSTKQNGGLVDLEIEDPNGDLVIVRGLRSRLKIRNLKAGERVFFFELQTTEARRKHGAAVRPRNFHEMPPDGGKRLEVARSMLLFGEGEGTPTA